MKRTIISMILLGVWAVATLAGCAKDIENDQTTTKDVVTSSPISDRAASGAAVSGTAASAIPTNVVEEEEPVRKKGLRKKEITKQRYANDRNIYEGNRNDGIYQYDLTGKEEKFYNINREFDVDENSYSAPDVLWVDNDWIFFSCRMDQEYYEIWRVPLIQTKSKNRLDFKKKEKLVKVKEWEAFITKIENKIFYCADGNICMLDLNTKEKRKLDTERDDDEIFVFRDAEGNPFVQDGKAYYDASENKLYQVDLNRWEKKSIGMYSDGSIGTDGTTLYFMQEDDFDDRFFVKYDARTGKKKKMFSADKLQDRIEALELPVTESPVVSSSSEMHSVLSDRSKVEDIQIKSIFVQGNRLYLAVEVEYEGEHTYIDDDDFTVSYPGTYTRFLFSCKCSDGKGLRYEKKVTEYLWKHSIAYMDYYCSTESFRATFEATGDFTCLVDGCIVMHFNDKEKEGDRDEEDEHRFVMYDLSEGTFRKVKKPSDQYGYIKAIGFSYYEEM